MECSSVMLCASLLAGPWSVVHKSFTPPSGNVHDCMRVMEAVECGAVPVLTGGLPYFRGYMPADLVETFVDLGDLGHLAKDLPLRALMPKPTKRTLARLGLLGCSRRDGPSALLQSTAACEASSRATAEQALRTLTTLARDDAAMRARRDAMIRAYEAWGWQQQVATRLQNLG